MVSREWSIAHISFSGNAHIKQESGPLRDIERGLFPQKGYVILLSNNPQPLYFLSGWWYRIISWKEFFLCRHVNTDWKQKIYRRKKWSNALKKPWPGLQRRPVIKEYEYFRWENGQAVRVVPNGADKSGEQDWKAQTQRRHRILPLWRRKQYFFIRNISQIPCSLLATGTWSWTVQTW